MHACPLCKVTTSMVCLSFFEVLEYITAVRSIAIFKFSHGVDNLMFCVNSL